MNTFDIIIAALLLFGFIRGLFKGLFVEIASLIALIAGVYGAIHFSYFVGDFLADRVAWEERYITIVSFAITFASLGMVNKILGGIFGTLKIGFILSIVLIVFTKLNNTIPFISEDQKEESILYEPVKNFAPTFFPNFLTVVNNETDLNISE